MSQTSFFQSFSSSHCTPKAVHSCFHQYSCSFRLFLHNLCKSHILFFFFHLSASKFLCVSWTSLSSCLVPLLYKITYLPLTCITVLILSYLPLIISCHKTLNLAASFCPLSLLSNQPTTCSIPFPLTLTSSKSR